MNLKTNAMSELKCWSNSKSRSWFIFSYESYWNGYHMSSSWSQYWSWSKSYFCSKSWSRNI